LGENEVMAETGVAINLEASKADLKVWVGSFLNNYERNLDLVESEDLASVIAAGALHYASLAYSRLGQERAYSQCRLAALCLLARKDTSVYSQGVSSLEEAKRVARQLEKLAKQYKRLSAMSPQVVESAYDGTARGASIEVYEAAARGLVEQMQKALETEETEPVEVAGGFELLGSRLLEAAAEINWRRRDLSGAIACWASLILLDGIEEEFHLMQRIEPGYCDLMSQHLKMLADAYLLYRIFED
jgi:hypothetical protein